MDETYLTATATPVKARIRKSKNAELETPWGVPVEFDPPRLGLRRKIKTAIVRRGLDGARLGFKFAQGLFRLHAELKWL